jgi:glucose-1-phosphatase
METQSPGRAAIIPKVVVFDLGKVLLDFDWRRGAERLARQCESSADALIKLFDYSPILIRFELGQLTGAEFFEQTRHEIGFAGGYDEFEEAFSDIFAEIRPMIEMQAALRQRHVPTFIFSNTNHCHTEFIRRRFPFFSNFDGYVLSYEVGAMKPDAQIYKIVEDRTGRRGGEILFMDDKKENVATALERGWQALQHNAPAATRDFVASTGLLD